MSKSRSQSQKKHRDFTSGKAKTQRTQRNRIEPTRKRRLNSHRLNLNPFLILLILTSGGSPVEIEVTNGILLGADSVARRMFRFIVLATCLVVKFLIDKQSMLWQ